MSNTADTTRRTQPLKVRITPDTYKRLEALAALKGTTLGGWITHAVESARTPRLDRREVRKRLDANRRTAAGVRA